MAHKIPDTKEEYEAAYLENTKVLGRYDTTRTVMPCPFCAAPDWLIFPVTAGLSNYRDIQQPATCGVCKRTARMVVDRDAHGNLGCTVVQLGGDDPPAWVPIRRANSPLDLPKELRDEPKAAPVRTLEDVPEPPRSASETKRSEKGL